MIDTGDDRVVALITFTGVERGSSTEVTLKYAHLVAFRGAEVVRIDVLAASRLDLRDLPHLSGRFA